MNLDSGLGFVHFQKVMEPLQQNPVSGAWHLIRKDPQNTPRGLAIDRADVAKALREAMLVSVEQVKAQGLNPDVRWVIFKWSAVAASNADPSWTRTLGVYNAIQSLPRTDGKLEVVSGTSYLQVVTFDDEGPHAQGLLAFSLSSDPGSKYAGTRRWLFPRNT